MEEKKPIKVSLGTVISIVIIVILIMLLGGMYFYYNYIYITNPQYTGIDNNSSEEFINSNENDVDEEDKENNPYEKYGELYWQFKDNKEDKTKLEFNNKKIQIEDGKAYLYSGNSRVEIDAIDGNAKFVNAYGEQTLEKVYILTEEGTIWKNVCENGLNSNFTKVNLSEKVIDMTNGNSETQIVEPPYFLLANGELVNEEGSSYDDLDENFIKSLGNSESQIFVKSDNTMYTYEYETEKYMQIKDENGQALKMKDAFIQWSSIRNNLVEETGGEDRIFVVTEKNKLLYVDGYENVTAKEYKEAIGKTIRTVTEEKKEIEYGETIDVRITFTDGTEMILEDANRNFFEN